MDAARESGQIPDGSGASAVSNAKLTRPVRLSGTQEYRLGDELLVYVPRSETALALNRSAVAIWDLCDGTRTTEDVSRELGRWLGCPSDALLSEVVRGIDALCELGLLKAG